jgi:hypothetical protein
MTFFHWRHRFNLCITNKWNEVLRNQQFKLKYFPLVKKTPSRFLDFACIAIIDKSITIFEALGKEDKSF